jgi:HprK-related kinase A
MPRPVSLKNASIGVIRAFAPTAAIGPPVHDTTKGSVAHMRAPSDSVRRASETAGPGWIVLPRYQADVETRLTPLSKARGLVKMAENAFNYSVHGRRGFELLARFVDACGCYDFAYGNLDAAVALCDDLAENA